MGLPQSDNPNTMLPGSDSVHPLKLAIVTRRFWPYSGSTEMAVGDLASQLRELGHTVDILTVRWEKNWPTHFQFQEHSVHRISRPTTSPWSSFRYLRSMTRELDEIQPDGIIVFELGVEAWSICKSFGGRIPLVIRIDSQTLDAQQRQSEFTARQVMALNMATRVLVKSATTLDRIKRHPSVKNEEIVVVPEGILIDHKHVRTPALHGASRGAISDAHPVLMIGPTQPLVVCGAPLEGDEGWTDLIHAWTRVLKRHPKARLWIVGDGKKGRQVWDQILDLNLVQSVIMPGSFDDWFDVLQAADVYVHPMRNGESTGFLPRAMAAGVCCIVASTQSPPSIIEDNVNGLVADPQDPRGIAELIHSALSNKQLRERLGQAALRSSATAYDIKRLVHHYLDPIKHLRRPATQFVDQ